MPWISRSIEIKANAELKRRDGRAPNGVLVPGDCEISATVLSESEIELDLLSTSDNSTSYSLRRQLESSGFVWIVNGLTAGDFPYIVSGLTASTLYSFRLAGVNQGAVGAYSDAVTGTTSAAGEDGFAFSFPDGKVDGNTLLLTTTLNDFGTRSSTAKRIFDRGTRVRENGTLNAYRQTVGDNHPVRRIADNASEIYQKPGVISGAEKYSDYLRLKTTSRPLRHARSSGHYCAWPTGGFIGNPVCMGGDAPEQNTGLVQIWHGKWQLNFDKLHKFTYSGKTGTFSVASEPGAIGEQVTLSNGIEAYVIYDSGTKLCIYAPAAERVSYDVLAGTTIIGNTSGAVCTITDLGTNTDDNNGFEKVNRVFDHPSGTNYCRLTWEHRKANLATSTTSPVNYPGSTYLQDYIAPGEWGCLIAIINKPLGIARGYLNGVKVWEHNMANATAGYNPSAGLFMTEIGWQPVRALANTVEVEGIYISAGTQFVLIGDAPTFGECTKFEPQDFNSWAEDQILLEYNQGAFEVDEDAWVYIYDGLPEPTDAGRPLQ